MHAKILGFVKEMPVDVGDHVQVGQLLATRPVGGVFDHGERRRAQWKPTAGYSAIRQIATVPGASVPPPFGGRYRQIMVYVDALKLEAYQMSPMDVVRAVNDSNLIFASRQRSDWIARLQHLHEQPAPQRSNETSGKVGFIDKSHKLVILRQSQWFDLFSEELQLLRLGRIGDISIAQGSRSSLFNLTMPNASRADSQL